MERKFVPHDFKSDLPLVITVTKLNKLKQVVHHAVDFNQSKVIISFRRHTHIPTQYTR